MLASRSVVSAVKANDPEIVPIVVLVAAILFWFPRLGRARRIHRPG